MCIEFPLLKKITHLGIVADPKVTISVLTKSGYRFFSFILDSGADCTMLPRYEAEHIGIDLSLCPKYHSTKIEGQGITCYGAKITVKIRQDLFPIRCLFSEKDTTPYLLGKMDIFDKYNIIFDNKNEKILFVPIFFENK
ncbi:MAG: hypothetical protein ABIF11_01320 [Nitrospirota bacterium]